MSVGFVVVNYEVFSGGLNHLPTATESVRDQKSITGFKRPDRAIVANQSDMTRNDMAKLIALGESSPISRRAGPCACDNPTRRIGKMNDAFVVWVALQHAIWKIAQTPGFAFTAATLEINYFGVFAHVSVWETCS